MAVEIAASGKIFSLDEARELLPLVRTITINHQELLAPIQTRLNKMLSNDPRRPVIEQEYEATVSVWRAKIERLGATVFGLWVVEFNMGNAFLCWRFPEHSLNYVRLADQPFSSRIKLASYIESHDPDWI